MEGRRLGNYEILDRVGAGGMGEVYRARDTRLGRLVALKFLQPDVARDPGSLRRFDREAKAVAALNHPNIVTLYAVEEVEGRPFLSMELVEGRKLSDVIAESRLSLDRLLDIACPLADALACAHAKGITHRDLKPGNVMLSVDGRVKILDFGLARLAPDPSSLTASETITAADVIAGTLGYVAPEQLLGRDADHRADAFAFGIILYEMATGTRPFTGPTPAAIASAVLRDVPRPLRTIDDSLPVELERIVRECLEKDPSQRPASLADVRDRLAALRDHPELQSGRLDARRRGATASAAPSLPSIAVLPFADMSPQRDQDFFCEGIADELITAMTRLQNLRVVSRTSSFQFKGTAADIREIGQRLGVGTVLEGSVRKAGDHLRITAQLIDVATGYHLWSSRFDRETKDVFAIQDEVARSVLAALQVSLQPGEHMAPMRPPTASVEAYEYYLRGRKYFYAFGPRNGQLARQMYARAIEIDPGYAFAWAGIADCCSYLFMFWERDQTALPGILAEALSASAKSLALDPTLAEAHVSRGVALSLAKEIAAAEQEFETAVQLNPASFEAYYFYARHCFTQGQLEKAAELYEKACAARPEDYQAPALVVGVYRKLGRHDEEERALLRALRITERRLETSPEDVRALYLGAGLLVERGDRERGLEWAQRALRVDPDDPAILYNVACVYAVAGRAETALDLLEKCVYAGGSYGQWMQHDSDLDSLRQHPRFQFMMEQLP